MASAVTTICFTEADLATFAAASGDRNPLHADAVYARRTAFGEPVVYGMLAVCAMLGAAPIEPLRGDGAVTIEFPRAVTCGIPYRVVVTTNGAIELRDGADVAVRVEIARDGGSARGADVIVEGKPGTTTAPPRITASRPPAASAAADVRELRARWALDATVVSDGLLRVLLHLSYVIGMEVPGPRALFAGGRVAFHGGGDAAAHDDAVVVAAGTVDERFDLQSVRVTFGGAEQPCATAALRAFVRHDPPALDLTALAPDAAEAMAWAGRRIWVTGASRGFGAALAASLALRGAEVVGVARQGSVDADQLADACAAQGGSFRLLAGDVTDAAWWDEHAPAELDGLICAAGPALRPLSLHAASLPRMQRHIATALACALTPLTACLPALERGRGHCLAISSDAAATPVATWPHYVAAKRALEGVIMTAAAAHPTVAFHLARPPRLRTTLTNVPMGHRDAWRVEPIARAVTDAVVDRPVPGSVQWIESDRLIAAVRDVSIRVEEPRSMNAGARG